MEKDAPDKTNKFVKNALIAWGIAIAIYFLLTFFAGETIAQLSNSILIFGVFGIPVLVFFAVFLRWFQRWLDRFPTKK